MNKYRLSFIFLVLFASFVEAKEITSCNVPKIFGLAMLNVHANKMPKSVLDFPPGGNYEFEEYYEIFDPDSILKIGLSKYVKDASITYYKKRVFAASLYFKYEDGDKVLTKNCFAELKRKVCVPISRMELLTYTYSSPRPGVRAGTSVDIIDFGVSTKLSGARIPSAKHRCEEMKIEFNKLKMR